MKKLILSLLFCFLITSAAQQNGKKLHVVYRPSYNITFYGIPKLINLHSFNGEKYKEIYEALKSNQHIITHEPANPISDEELLKIHTPEYLKNLQSSLTIAQVVEIHPLRYVPNFILQRSLLKSIKYATQGTLDALELALQHGSAINLAGGYHHAKSEKGEGFCFFSDFALAVKRFHDKHPGKKVMIIDLDAHQGNGHESIFFNHPEVVIFDVYNRDMYPREINLYPTIQYNFPLISGKSNPNLIGASHAAFAGNLNDENYLQLLQEHLDKAIQTEQPALIIYVAGTDILDTDPLGYFNVSKDGIIKRDLMVFESALRRNIPIVMLLAGGYTPESSQVVSESIINLQEKFFNK